jgi:proteic killer suppression protein
VHAAGLRLQLAALDNAKRPEDLSALAWALHPLKGDLKGPWALTVNGNWRMVFAFEGKDAVLVDYLDHH